MRFHQFLFYFLLFITGLKDTGIWYTLIFLYLYIISSQEKDKTENSGIHYNSIKDGKGDNKFEKEMISTTNKKDRKLRNL